MNIIKTNRFVCILPLFISSIMGSLYLQYLYSNFLITILLLIINISSFVATHYFVIPKLQQINIRQGLYGHDIYLKGTEQFKKKIAESLGIGIATSYFGVIFIYYMIFYKLEQNQDTLHIILTYITFGTFLGFVDDVLDLRWRHKLIYPFFFSLPLILNYKGNTSIHFPTIVSDLIGIDSLDIYYLFYIYLILLSIFCINSINIYAGISGIETGQSLIIGIFLILENTFCVLYEDDKYENYQSSVLLLPFIIVTMSLFIFNKVEKKTFVGDTFCYFAGCCLASASIVGKYPVKLLFYFIPQLFNFIVSLPQILKIIPCPRHRLPKMDVKTGLMETTCPENYNLINIWLLKGKLTEQQLGDELLNVQVLVNSLIFLTIRLIKFNN